ncbi:heat shock protein DnaJ-like protein [Calothrix sp. NIES-4071]|nr:heat shock protein DnaJ-like protein [Calothrix sp. NIES-4071]BAZ56362.1 heat shock protein DnaJ-like protein [Calothrix sp. NIES-4105]
MSDTNHYDTLKVSEKASQAEIKQAYRRLVKLFHPDTNPESTDSEEIIRINAAYEVLGDEKNRQSYDRGLNRHSRTRDNTYNQRTTTAQPQQVKRQTGRDIDELVDQWLQRIYHPVNDTLTWIIDSLQEQIDNLSADPFDDDLLEAFQEYLDSCREQIKVAQTTFRTLPNPPILARTAAHLYHCLNRISDGLDELKYFPLSYDENYLHTGQEMFRIAEQLLYEAQDSVNIYR